MKCATKYDRPITHLTLGTLLHYLGISKNSNVCRYSADMEENANKLHFKCTDFNSSTCVTVYAECTYVFIKILFSSLNTMLIVDKHCSDVCCDEFTVLQIDRKSKQVKEQWHGNFYLQPVWKTNRHFKLRQYQNLWIINKTRGDKYAIYLHFLPICWILTEKFEFLISQGSVATHLRWGV